MQRLKKLTLLFLTLAMLAGVLSGCGNDVSEEPGETQSPELTDKESAKPNTAADDVFTLNCNKENSFNPFVSKDTSNIIVTQLMYDSLVNMDTAYNYSPGIVSEWKSEDGSCWYFTVDTSLKFWDGSNITAYDAAYSVQRALRSPQFSDRLKSVIGTQAVSDDTFVINISGINTRFPALLTIPLIKNGSAGDAIPLGSGPYVLSEDLTKLTVNTYHKNSSALPVDAVYLTEIREIEDIISSFEDSTIDLVVNDPTSFTNIGYGSANEKRPYSTTNMHYIGFNMNSEFFSNTLFRKAMNYIIDREYIVTDIMGGMATAATLPFNPATEYYNENFSELISYSVSKASKALDDAEVQDYDSDSFREIMITGIPVEIGIDFIVCSDNAYKVQAARAIAGDMQEMGVKVNLHELSWTDYKAALNAGNYDMYYAETKLGADFNLRNLLFYGGTLNYGGINDSNLDEYVNTYMSANDEERQKAADLMFKYLTDTAPIVTICFEKQQLVTHMGVISGLRPTQYNMFNGIEDWTMDLK